MPKQFWMKSAGLASECRVYLAQLPKLQRLTLRGERVDDTWNQPLTACKQLQTLVLLDCDAGDELVTRLMKALPRVEISHSKPGKE